MTPTHQPVQPVMLATVQQDSEARGGSERVTLTIIVQNLQKKAELATRLVERDAPDILLAQELSLHSEATNLFRAHYTSQMGYGTAIHCRGKITNVRRVKSPVAEFGGFIYKKTTVADCDGVQCVSFHGYNGTPFRRNISSLVSHVQAVLDVLGSGPAIFAGDFNSWTTDHLNAVSELLYSVGFHRAFSWPYPGGDRELDHAFLRGMKLLQGSTFETEADHLGAKLIVEHI